MADHPQTSHQSSHKGSKEDKKKSMDGRNRAIVLILKKKREKRK